MNDPVRSGDPVADRGRLTLTDLAPMIREVRRDKRYRSTPLGGSVGRYIRFMRNEWGATERSLEDYESVLARFAIEHADLELRDFEPPVGTERIREFVDGNWGDAAVGTRRKVTSILKSFFRWAYERELVASDPTLRIRLPKKRGVERRAHEPDRIKALIAAQPELRDRVAIALMARLALRKNELRLLCWRDITLTPPASVRVHGKGGRIDLVPLVYEDLRLELEALARFGDAAPDEYLLFPVRVGNVRSAPHARGIIREDRDRPMQPSTMHRWWQRCLERASFAHFPMHELRHTAITEFIRASGSIEVARLFARHASVATTVDIYGHLNQDDLVRAMKLAAARWKE